MRVEAKVERAVVNSGCPPQEMLSREEKALRADRNKLKVHQTELKAIMYAMQQLSIAIGVKEERVSHMRNVVRQVNDARSDRFRERRAAQHAKNKAARSCAAEASARAGITGDVDEVEVKEGPVQLQSITHVVHRDHDEKINPTEEAEEKEDDGRLLDDEAEEVNEEDEDEEGADLGLHGPLEGLDVIENDEEMME
jgi:hypothetical protein